MPRIPSLYLLLILCHHYTSIKNPSTSNHTSQSQTATQDVQITTFSDPTLEISSENIVNQVPEFTEVSDPSQLRFKNPNLISLSALITKSWTNIWLSMSQIQTSSLELIHADYKHLDNVKGIHWRLVFKLASAENRSFIGLDIAVLENGMVDIFRNVHTRILDDIRLLYNVMISESKVISLEFLRESFLHNSPMILRTDNLVEKSHLNPGVKDVDVILNDVGADLSNNGQLDVDAQIGKGFESDVNNYD